MSGPPESDSVFTAVCPLQVASGDHPLVAIVEPERAVVVSVPEGKVLAEIGLSEEAEGVDVAWIGHPPRLLVVSRLPERTVVHLLEVGGGGPPRLCSEKRVEATLRLVAINGAYGLLAGSSSTAAASTAILTRTDDNLSIHPVAARGLPSAAGALGLQLVVAFTGVIEIWDPVERVAKRRLKLPRPAQIREVGGSDRQIWLTTISEPNRLEVLPLVNRGQPRAHDLREPIGNVASHPKLDVVVCSGADSGRLYVVDLEGRMPARGLSNELFGGRPMAMSLIGGRAPAIVAIASGQPPRAVGFDGVPVREWPAAAMPPTVHVPEPMPLLPTIEISSMASGAGRSGGAGGAGRGGIDGSGVIRLSPPPPPSRAAAPTVFDSMLGQQVEDPTAQGEPGEPRANISGAATMIARGPRSSARDASKRASTGEAAPPGASPASPALAPPATNPLIERLQSWRERSPADEPPVSIDSGPVFDSRSLSIGSSDEERRLRLSGTRLFHNLSADVPGTALPPVATGRATMSAAGVPSTGPVLASSRSADWRQALIEWVSTHGKGSMEPPLWSPSVGELLRRLALAPQLAPAVQLLYGAHLLGRRGVPAAEVAEVLGALEPEARWREALGAGALAAAGLTRRRRSRLCLAGVALRVLDDRPAKFGAVVGAGGPPRRSPAALVYEDDASSEELACAAAALVGSPVLAIAQPLAAGGPLRAAFLEARLRGAIAAVPYPWTPPLPGAPALYLTPYRGDAEATGFEVLVLPLPPRG